MRNTWRRFFRQLAAGCIAAGSVAWSSAMCYAVQLAFDSASDPVYANGWQEGDAGGTGFGPWSFDGTSVDLVYGAAPAHEIDNGLQTGSQNSSPYNNIGRAWTIYNFNGSAVGPSNLPQDATDFTRAGRALPAPLQAGQTISVVIDNPIERRFKRGYSINLNSGGGNVCFNGESCTPGVSPVHSNIFRTDSGASRLWTIRKPTPA